MVEVDERESLLRSLKGYLAELAESGMDELSYATLHVAELQCRMDGDTQARLLFLMTGNGFAGEAGGLLEKIIGAMGFSADSVCLLSIGSCPDGARDSWRRSIAGRVASVAPEAIVALGDEAVRLMLLSDQPLERLRGRFHDFNGTPLMPSYHPGAMLENEALKRDVWNDMKQVMERLGQPR